MAVVKVLEQFYKDKNFQLKWVNDIYLGTYKVGGIITEAALDLESSSAGNFIMGIGLNLSTKDFPADFWPQFLSDIKPFPDPPVHG